MILPVLFTFSTDLLVTETNRIQQIAKSSRVIVLLVTGNDRYEIEKLSVTQLSYIDRVDLRASGDGRAARKRRKITGSSANRRSRNGALLPQVWVISQQLADIVLSVAAQIILALDEARHRAVRYSLIAVSSFGSELHGIVA